MSRSSLHLFVLCAVLWLQQLLSGFFNSSLGWPSCSLSICPHTSVLSLPCVCLDLPRLPCCFSDLSHDRGDTLPHLFSPAARASQSPHMVSSSVAQNRSLLRPPLSRGSSSRLTSIEFANVLHGLAAPFPLPPSPLALRGGRNTTKFPTSVSHNRLLQVEFWSLESRR